MLLMCNKNLIVSNFTFVHWLKKKKKTTTNKPKNKTTPNNNTVFGSKHFCLWRISSSILLCFFNWITEDVIAVSYFEELLHFIKQSYKIVFILFNGHLFVLISSWHHFYFYILWQKMYIFWIFMWTFNFRCYCRTVHQYFHSWS